VKVFLHDRIRQLSTLQQACNGLIIKHNEGASGWIEALDALLDQMSTTYEALHLIDHMAICLEFKAQLQMARRGIDPLTLIRQTTQRRDFESRMAFKLLMASSEQLRGDLNADRANLKSAREQLGNILLAALQNGLVAEVGLDLAAPTQAMLEAFWRRAVIDSQLGLAVKQVAIAVSLPDVVLMLWELAGDASLTTSLAQE
jgi:hypothetical protein